MAQSLETKRRAYARKKLDRKRRLAQGLCAISGCPDKREPDRTMCQRHIDKTNKAHRKRRKASTEHQRRVRLERVKQGLCSQAGCPNNIEAGKTMCRSHLDRYARRGWERSTKNVAVGNCRRCGKPVVDRYKRCQECREYAAAWQRASSPKVQQKRRARLKQGQCSVIGCPDKPEADRLMCRRHLDLMSGYNRKYVEKADAAGVCRRCHKNPQAEGRKYCQDCLNVHVALNRVNRQKRKLGKQRVRVRPE